MKILVPVDASIAALAPIEYLESLTRSGVQLEVLVLNVQPRFHRHVARFTSRAARDGVRAERSRVAMAKAIEALSERNIPFRALAEVGTPAERIAAVAEREQVDEVMMGVGRHPAWLRWVNLIGWAGLAIGRMQLVAPRDETVLAAGLAYVQG